MLTLTETAAEAVRELVAESPVISEETGGVRLFSEDSPPGEEFQIHLTGAELPAEDDYVIDDDGARVFVEAELAARLHDKLLDAEVTPDGVSFRFIQQDDSPDDRDPVA